MTICFEGVTVIGVGLLGASLGLALKKRKAASHVTGVGRNLVSLENALRYGAVDAITMDVEDGVAAAELVVIATPAGSVTSVLDRVLAAAPASACILDVASTKGTICAHARRVCARPRRFVGCHPMAGSEHYGPEHGREDLFLDTVCLVEKDEEIDSDVRARVCALWNTVGARVVDLDVRRHDAVLACTSHTPHVMAAVLSLVAEEGGARREMVGNSFLDATRVAASRAELWRDICLENRIALSKMLTSVQSQLQRFEALLTTSDAGGLENFFTSAALARSRVLES